MASEYDTVKELLASCQLLDNYLQIFIDNLIDDTTIKLLDDEGLKELIPIIGHRIKFKEVLKCFKKENESLLGNISLSTSILDEYVPLHPVESYKSPAPSSTLTFEFAESNTSRPKGGDITTEVSDEDYNSSKNTDLSDCYRNSSNSDGRAILSEGRRTGGLFKESDRRRLSQIIILHLLDKNSARVISSCEFRRIATEIQQLFPQENSLVYYSPYESGNKGRKKNASGKLYETYISRRRKLRARGELPGTSRSFTSTSTSAATDTATTSSVSATTDNYTPDDETCQEKLIWLKNSIEPWHMVEEYWKDTYKIRLEPIRLGLEEFTVEEYLKTYPALQQPQGFTLLLEDFEKLYEKNDGLYSNIVLLRENIIALAREKQNKTRDKDIKRTITNYIDLADDSDPETLTNVALILLPYIIGSSQSKKRGKDHWKPSRSEIRDGFLTQAASEAEVTSIIVTRREKLQRLGRTLQPFIIFVGESVAQVKTSYVIVNNNCYKFVKLVTAVDAAFKIFHATGAHYPEECMDIWLVIQIGFYKIKTAYDRTNQSSTCLLNDLRLLE